MWDHFLSRPAKSRRKAEAAQEIRAGRDPSIPALTGRCEVQRVLPRVHYVWELQTKCVEAAAVTRGNDILPHVPSVNQVDLGKLAL